MSPGPESRSSSHCPAQMAPMHPVQDGSGGDPVIGSSFSVLPHVSWRILTSLQIVTLKPRKGLQETLWDSDLSTLVLLRKIYASLWHAHVPTWWSVSTLVVMRNGNKCLNLFTLLIHISRLFKLLGCKMKIKKVQIFVNCATLCHLVWIASPFKHSNVTFTGLWLAGGCGKCPVW